MTHNNDLYLVDGSGYIFRAYFALPQNLTNPQGQPVGAVLGFCNMMLKLLTDFHAPSIAVVFDAKGENFRNEIYTDYKANREAPPADLIPQFGLIREATAAFNIPALELEGYEADDLIATYAKLAKAQGRNVIIVGSDKDLMQLVDDQVNLFDPVKQRKIGAEEVREKFGVLPDKVVDVQALAGDSVDNVPGVPGIGVKTAAQLIDEFGNLETLLERAGEIKQNKRRESLIEFAEQARISKQLVMLDDTVDVPLGLDDLKVRDPDNSRLISFLESQGFKSIVNRLRQGGTATIPDAGAPPEQSAPARAQYERQPDPKQNTYTLIQDEKLLLEWLEAAKTQGVLSIDCETTALTPAIADLVGVALSTQIGRAAYVPVGHTKPQADTDLFGESNEDQKTDLIQMGADIVLNHLKPILEDPSILKIGHNLKYDWQIFKKHGIDMSPTDDTILLSYTLDGSSHGHGMDELAQLHCGHNCIKYEDVAGKGAKHIGFANVDLETARDYAAEDADITLRLHHILKPRLVPEKMTTLYENIERPLVQVIGQMELHGIKVDTARLKSLSGEFGQRMMTLEEEVHKAAGHPFNLASPKQVGQVLFEEMGLKGGKKTKTGDWSTAVDVLENLALEGHEIVQKLLDWRQMAKLKSTYSDALQESINPATGRVHTSYTLTGTSTGRLASSDPNLQNIPIRTEEGRKIRTAFIAEEGHVLLSIDYSQIELRLAAALANVKALKQAFIDEVDIHRLTAAQVFDTPVEGVTSEQRRQAKAVNFGIIYGISGFGLGKQLGIDNSTANEFIRRYLSRFPELQEFMEAKKEEARKNGYVMTALGRKCFTPYIRDKNPMRRNGAERAAINAPLQGTAADIIKLAMIDVHRFLNESGARTRMLLQVHDELIFECPVDEVEQIAPKLQEIMQGVADFGVPLVAEAGWGNNWDAAH